jgi:hypothetical protein
MNSTRCLQHEEEWKAHAETRRALRDPFSPVFRGEGWAEGSDLPQRESDSSDAVAPIVDFSDSPDAVWQIGANLSINVVEDFRDSVSGIPSSPAKKASSTPVATRDYSELLCDVSDLLEAARRASARAVNAFMTATYWEVGRRIVEFEQGGAKRAGYGEQLLKRLSSAAAALPKPLPSTKPKPYAAAGRSASSSVRWIASSTSARPCRATRPPC